MEERSQSVYYCDLMGEGYFKNKPFQNNPNPHIIIKQLKTKNITNLITGEKESLQIKHQPEIKRTLT